MAEDVVVLTYRQKAISVAKCHCSAHEKVLADGKVDAIGLVIHSCGDAFPEPPIERKLLYSGKGATLMIRLRDLVDKVALCRIILISAHEIERWHTLRRREPRSVLLLMGIREPQDSICVRGI